MLKVLREEGDGGACATGSQKATNEVGEALVSASARVIPQQGLLLQCLDTLRQV